MPAANENAFGTSMPPLNRPIWSALTTRQRTLAEGGALARRRWHRGPHGREMQRVRFRWDG
jgi:hypothetical protein